MVKIIAIMARRQAYNLAFAAEVTKHLRASVAEVKSQFSAFLKASEGGPIVVTRNGRPVYAVRMATGPAVYIDADSGAVGNN